MKLGNKYFLFKWHFSSSSHSPPHPLAHTFCLLKFKFASELPLHSKSQKVLRRLSLLWLLLFVFKGKKYLLLLRVSNPIIIIFYLKIL